MPVPVVGRTSQFLLTYCIALAGFAALAQAQLPFAGVALANPVSTGTNKSAPLINTVTLQVTALDAKGRPVTGLTCADFEIFDGGKAQRLVPCQASAPQPPSTLIVWDLLNSIRDHRGYQADLIVRALESLKPADGSVYLYLLTNRGDIYPVHPLPMPDQPEASGGAWIQQIRPLLDHALQEVTEFRPMDYQNEGIRAGTTFLRLSQFEDGLSRIPSPKTVVWITTGAPNLMACPYGCRDVSFPEGAETYLAGKCSTNCPLFGQGDCIDYAAFLRHFTEAMRNDNIGLFSVEETPIGKLARADHGSPKDTLQQLSQLTGGRVYERGDIAKAITSSLSDAPARYSLQFEAPADGKYHKVRVVSTRKGVRIEAPQGYFADQR